MQTEELGKVLLVEATREQFFVALDELYNGYVFLGEPTCHEDELNEIVTHGSHALVRGLAEELYDQIKNPERYVINYKDDEDGEENYQD